MSKKGAIFLIVFVIALIILIPFYFALTFNQKPVSTPDNNIVDKPIEEEIIPRDVITYEYLQNHQYYYILSGVLTKYYSYVSSGNEEVVLKLLSEEYKDLNNINDINIKEKVMNYSNKYIIKLEEVFLQKENDKTTKYYTKATLIRDDLDYVLDTNNITVYNIVYLNEFDSTFLIEPINEAIYKGVING